MRSLLSIMNKALLILAAIMLIQLFSVSTIQAAPPASGGGKYHTVRHGETLSSIGRYYGVNAYQISRANGLKNPNHIYSGQHLYIPAKKSYYSQNSYHNHYQKRNYNYGHNRHSSYNGYQGYNKHNGHNRYSQYTSYNGYNKHNGYNRYSHNNTYKKSYSSRCYNYR